MNKTRLITIVVAALIAWLFGTGQFQDKQQTVPAGQTATAGGKAAQKAGSRDIAVQDLPAEARKVLTLISQGGPFPYGKDGTVFQNREKLLPNKKKGFYREYTVPTPGASNRGARRIVAGGNNKTQPGVMYYTSDHYRSFKRILETQ